MFKIQKIQKNIYKIWEPWYKEFANIYLFKNGDKCLIFDAGLGLFNLKHFLVDLGYQEFYIALSHVHFDHCGGVKHFNPEEIIISKKQRDNILNKKLLALNYFYEQDLILDGYNYEKNIFDYSYLKNINLNKNKQIVFGEFKFNILGSPGHTDDSLIYYEENNKILISGDSLYDGKIYFDFPNSNKIEFIESLKKIDKIKFNTVLAGHNFILGKEKSQLLIDDWIACLKIKK